MQAISPKNAVANGGYYDEESTRHHWRNVNKRNGGRKGETLRDKRGGRFDKRDQVGDDE